MLKHACSPRSCCFAPLTASLSFCIALQTENIRIAYIDEIAPGVSQVSFKLFVPLEQYELGPLKLTGFKVSRPQLHSQKAAVTHQSPLYGICSKV
jgi:hypothetical protein